MYLDSNVFRLLFLGLLGFAAGCTGDARLPHPDCSKYVQCVGGVWTVRSCPTLHRFDVDSGSCKSLFSSKCGHPSCVEGDTRAVAKDCKGYEECEGGRWSAKKCSLLHGFDPRSNQCTFRYDCSEMPECSEDSTKPIEGQCKEYWKCSGGRFVKKSCSWPYTFNPVDSECDYGNYCNTCKGWTSRPVKDNCKSYEICSSNGVVESRKCPVFQKFDPKELRCTWSWKVKCPVDPNKPHRKRNCPF